MRSIDPIPGNPWPHDMVISIENDPYPFDELLFVRSAWQLDIPGVPPSEFAAGIGISERPADHPVADLEWQWLVDWNTAWLRFDHHSGPVNIPEDVVLREIAATADEDLADRFWHQSDIWRHGIDREAFWRWRVAHDNDLHRSLDESPEWRSLPALIDSWKRGLTTVIELSYAGQFAERINRQHLVVSRHTRGDRDLYAAALGLRANPIG